MRYSRKSMSEEHGLKVGRSIIKLSATRDDGKKLEWYYLYDTAASFASDSLKKFSDYKWEYVPWDGIVQVSVYNGD